MVYQCDMNSVVKFLEHPSRKRTQSLEDTKASTGGGGYLKPLGSTAGGDRAVVHLFYYEDMAVSEISKVLGRKEATVRVQLMRSNWVCRDILEGMSRLLDKEYREMYADIKPSGLLIAEVKEKMKKGAGSKKLP